MPTITIIAAMTKAHVIGKKNQLPWYIPEDLKNFKRLTTNNTIIMGKNTYLSIGRPLPNRNNIVVSTSMQPVEGVTLCKSIPEAIEKAKALEKDIFIIGGATIYEQTITIADKMYISYVKNDYDGEVYFPQFDEDEWETEKREDHQEFELVIYTRKQK